MGKPLSVLIAEACVDNTATIAQVLQGRCSAYFERVDNMVAFANALSNSSWDLVVCNIAIFDIPQTLLLAKKSGTGIVFIAKDSDAHFILAALAAGARNIVHASRLMDLADLLPPFGCRAALEPGHAQQVNDEQRICFGLAPSGMAHIGLNGNWIKSNPKLQEILGYSESELSEIGFHAIIHPDDLPEALELQADLLVGRIPHFSMEQRLKRSDNQPVLCSMTLSIVRDSRNCPLYFVAIIEDITHLRKVEEQLHFLSSHDMLTRLPNRNVLFENFVRRLAHAENTGQQLALLLLDLDRFKLINASHAHASGDMFMSICGRRISGCLENDDFAARLDGDEFALIHSQALSRESVSAYAGKLLDAVSTPVHTEAGELAITTCIGIALYPEDGDDISALLRSAYVALHRAKAAGGNQIRFHAGESDIRAPGRLALVNGLEVPRIGTGTF